MAGNKGKGGNKGMIDPKGKGPKSLMEKKKGGYGKEKGPKGLVEKGKGGSGKGKGGSGKKEPHAPKPLKEVKEAKEKKAIAKGIQQKNKKRVVLSTTGSTTGRECNYCGTEIYKLSDVWTHEGMCKMKKKSA